MNFLKNIFFVILLSLHTGGFCDSFSWEGEDLTIQTGYLPNIEKTTKMKYRFAYRSGGFGYLELAIEVSWCDLDDKKHNQILFEGKGEHLPKKLFIDKSSSTVEIKFTQPCDPDPEDHIQSPLFYKYNADKRLFEKKI